MSRLTAVKLWDQRQAGCCNSASLATQCLLRVGHDVEYDVGVFFDTEIKTPPTSDPALPADGVILLGSDGWVAQILEKVGELLVESFLDVLGRIGERTVESDGKKTFIAAVCGVLSWPASRC